MLLKKLTRFNSRLFLTQILHALVILCMLVPNTAALAAPTQERPAESQPDAADLITAQDFVLAADQDQSPAYQAPQFTHPQPRMGSRSGRVDDLSIVLQAPPCQAGGDLVLASGEECSLQAGEHSYDSVVVQDGGSLILEGDTGTNAGVTINTASFTIDTGGLVSADGLGYSGGSGPGAGTDAGLGAGAGGGAHGGQGGSSSAGGGESYGDVYTPLMLGSGGGNKGSAGGTGGGAVHLSVSGTLALNGTISANGSNGVEDYGGSGGGAGGSIYIQAVTFSGTGLIRAGGGNGGVSGMYPNGGGGGGGRIAVDAGTNTFSGAVHAYGGSGQQYGGPGTIYWTAEDKLVVDNNGHNGRAAGLVQDTYAFSSLELTGYGHLSVLGTGSVLTLTQSTVSGDGISILSSYGSLNLPAAYTVENFTLDVRGLMSGMTDLTLQSNGRLILHAYTPLYSGTHSFDTITVNSGSTLELVSYDNGDSVYTNDLPFELVCSTLTVNAGGLVSANGRGYASGKGPGAGTDAGLGQGAGGGAHGGQGGNSSAAGGESYDDVYMPQLLGSGGGNRSSAAGGAGGGAVHLTVIETMAVNGSISANGTNGSEDYGGSGGGAGGSIHVQTSTLSGTGIIRANGGNGGVSGLYNNGGGGGGGRIAVDADTNTFSGTVQAYGGSGQQYGGAGTIYWAAVDKLVVDNNDHNGRAAGLLEATYAFSGLELVNHGHLQVLGSGSVFALDSIDSSGDGSAMLSAYGVVTAPENFVIENYTLDVLGRLNGVNDLFLAGGGGLILHACTVLYSGVFSFDSVFVDNGGILELAACDNGDDNYSNDAPFELHAGMMSIDGVVRADGLGYAKSSGPGAGTDGGWTHGGGGAGHGGSGGDGEGGFAGGAAYDSLYEPVLCGSGGGNNGDYAGGAGGGALRLIVSAELDINGQLSSDGQNGVSNNMNNAGGGSGGSIWISAGTLSGSGVLRAGGGNGGNGGYGQGGGGAGGRIAVYADTNTFTGALQVPGGSGHQSGAAGSLYMGVLDPALSTVNIVPDVVTADGTSTAAITVTLLNESGDPIPGRPVEIALAYGADAVIDGQTVSINEFVSIGSSDENGVATATIAAVTSGQRTVKARVEQENLQQQGVVDFVAGPVDAAMSLVETDLDEVPADGSSAATITVTVKDAFGNPVADAAVTLSAGGNAVVTQPADVTNVNGQTSGTIRNATTEVVTVNAVAGGVSLDDEVQVSFVGTDLSAALTAAAEVAPGAVLLYALSVRNLETLAAPDTTLTLVLPAGVSMIGHSGPSDPVRDGDTYTWSLGTIYSGGQIDFTVTTLVAQSMAVGTVLSGTLTAATSAADQNSANDTDSAATTIVEGYGLSAAITPAGQTLYLGGSASYTIRIYNDGLYADSYTLTQSGLDSGWISWSDSPITIAPGAFADVSMTVQITECLAESTLPFEVLIDSGGSDQTETLYADLLLQQAPQITLESPGDNTTSGARTVLFNWRTHPDSSGLLSVYPAGSPGEAQTFTSGQAASHAVLVEDLQRYVTYEWTIEATSDCGVSTSTTRSVTIGSGIVFTNHSQDITIDRDYNQQVALSVHNEDTQAHTLTASVLNPHDDLIVNFVGSGSVDETITLQAGETRSLTLAVHAQDAAEIHYDLTARLIADEGGTPSEDNAVLHLTVLAEGDFSITEGATDPLTLGTVYTITNHGKTITDLSIAALDPGNSEPAQVYIQPAFSHARLETGESLTVTVYPIYTAEDAAQYAANPSMHMARPVTEVVEDIGYDLQVSGAGETQTHTAAATCAVGNQIYMVLLEDCTSEFPTSDWYCTNRPEIDTPMQTPYFMNAESISDAYLRMSFAPHSNVLPHDGQVSFNGHEIGNFSNATPSGEYTFPISSNYLNSSIAGMATQNVQMSTQHFNGGHYVSATSYTLGLMVDQAATFVCAASELAAIQSVEETYDCQVQAVLNWDEFIHDYSVANLDSCEDPLECETGASQAGTTIAVSDPINARTGSFAYSSTDLSTRTSSGELIFLRSYASGAVDRIDAELGNGWTHNHNASLVFPDDPGGEEGFLFFRSVSGNDYIFKIEDDGTFLAGPGITAELTRAEGPPVTYTLVTMYQSVLTFDESGQLLSREDELGRTYAYVYDVEDRLLSVSSDGGARHFNLAYSTAGQLETVSDHSGRSVSYGYDASGDLVSYTDVLGQVWTYEYDSEHLMIRVGDPRGIDTVQTEYDMQGRAFRQFDSLGNLLVRIEYNADGSSTVYDALGRAQTHDFNDNNTLAASTDALGATNSRTYDDNFRPDSITDAGGHTTSLSWSADGNDLEGVLDAGGNQTDLTYDTSSNLTSVTDPLGYLTSYEYDGMLLTGSVDALNNSSSYTYTTAGYLESVTDPMGNTSTYSYDQFGQLTSTTDSQGNGSSFSYDNLGRMTDSTDAQGRVTHNEYDAAGRLLKVTHNYDPGRPQNDANRFNIVSEFQYDAVGNQTAVTDTYGNTTQYQYDDAGRLLRVIDPAGNQTSNSYNELGQLVSSSDALGRTTSYQYDAAGRLWRTIDALGHTSSTSYNPDGTVAARTDALGGTTTYIYDDLQRLLSSTDPLGGVTTSSYDAGGRLVATTDALGNSSTYEYDALGRPIRQTDPGGGVTETFYDAAGNMVQTVDPLGNATTYAYDSLGRLVTITDAAGNSSTYTYDSLGQRVAVTDAAGNTTSYSYDELGRLLATTDALNNTSTTGYDALGRVISGTDALGRTQNYVYNNLGRLVSQTDPAGGITGFGYDAAGNQVSVTDRNGATSTTIYNALNRPVTATDPNGNSSSSSYNALGNLVAFTDALGNSTAYSYDALGRQTHATDALGDTTSYSYDSAGNRTAQTDANGVVTAFEYDDLGRLTAVVENYKPGVTPDHETNVRTEYSYDAAGNRLTIRDANAHQTSFSYDALGRVLSESDPLGNSWSYSYDALGDRITLTDANGAVTNYGYDALRRLVAIDYPGSADDVSFSYNAVGQRTSMQDGMGSTSWSYDVLGRPDAIQDPFSQTVGYSYDAAGNRTGLVYPDGKSVSYSYDPAGRLAQVTDWESQVTSYSYDAANRITNVALPNGVTSSYSYDSAGHLLQLEHATAAETLASFQYTYDAVGNRTQVVENVLQPPGEGPETYFFDDLEDGDANWSVTGDWALVESDFHSPAHAWSLNPNDDNQRNTDTSLELAVPVAIPADAVRPELSFYDPFSAASDTTATVEITSDDGLTWTALLTLNASDNRPDWILRRISLEGYQGEAVRIRFRAVQGSAWTSDVWLIDDVRIGERELLPELEFPFVDDVEAGPDNWEPGGQWALVEDTASSPTHAWSLNPDDEYQRDTDFALELAGQITVPENAVRPDLTWYESLNIASDTTVTVEVTIDDGQNWTELAASTSTSNREAWTLRRIPLDDYLAETIRIRFRAVQGAAWTSDAWLVDDVRIGERAALPVLEFPFVDDVEAGPDNWEPGGQWALVEDTANSPIHAWSLNPDDEYQRETDFVLELAGQITVPEDAVRPELSWYDSIAIASDTTVTVEITIDDGLNWTPAATFTSAHNRAAWTLRRIPLDGYQDETIRIRFRAVQGTAWTSDVWLIDDVRIGERAVPPELSYPFMDDMESGLLNWAAEGQWDVVADDAHSPTQVLSLNPAAEYQRDTDFSVDLAGSVLVPGTAIAPELHYYDHFDIASDTVLTVQITSDDGLSWTELASFTSVYNRPDWVLRQLSLAGYQGETIRIRFRAEQGSAWYNDLWLIDDVAIAERQPLPVLDFPFTDNLESGAENWLPDGQWTVVTDAGYGGSAALSLNPGAEYQRSTDFAVELNGSITIPVAAVRPELSYHDLLTIASDTTLSVEITIDDGLNWTEAASFNSAHNRSDWILRRVSLEGYQGETMRMRLRAVQGSSWTSDVWVVDDVRIGEREALPDLGFPFSDDMESGDSNWEPDGQWILADDEAYSSTHAWSLNPAEDYQRDTDFALELAGQTTVAGDAVDPELSWYDRIEAASDTILQIELSTNAGLDWIVLQSFSAADNSAEWTLQEVSLTDYAGETITIRYRAIQGSSWSVDSWLIDDVQIAVSAPAATATPTPTATGTATVTATATPTASATPTPSSTPESSATAEATQTPTPTVETTHTFTPTPSPTPEHTPTPTPTSTLTPTPTALAANSSMGSVALAAIVMQPVAPIPAPAAQAGEVVSRTIDYSYDPLYRLTAADYDDGSYFHYSYDAVGNRLSEGTNESSSAYAYDAANRLIDVDGVAYTWDANGNLLSDGDSSYSYNTANRLVGVSQDGNAYTFAYNGLGDRLQQHVDGELTTYTLDLNSGLTQVLTDGDTSYLYGLGRFAELQSTGWQMHLTDALGSVRQLVDIGNNITHTQTFTPFGSVRGFTGELSTSYGFTGEWTDATGLVHLRARYYNPENGSFFQPDPWEGSIWNPVTTHPYLYAGINPVLNVDPSGKCWDIDPISGEFYERSPYVIPGICPNSSLESAVGDYGNGGRNVAGTSPQYYPEELEYLRIVFDCPLCSIAWPPEPQLPIISAYAEPIWTLVLYEKLPEVEEYWVQSVDPATPASEGLPVGIISAIPIVGSYSSGQHIIERINSNDPLMYQYRALLRIGAGVPGFSAGFQCELAELNEFSMAGYVNAGVCSATTNFWNSSSFGCGPIERQRNLVGEYDSQLILVRTERIHDAGGYEMFGRRNLFSTGRLRYYVYGQFDDRSFLDDNNMNFAMRRVKEIK